MGQYAGVLVQPKSRNKNNDGDTEKNGGFQGRETCGMNKTLHFQHSYGW